MSNAALEQLVDEVRDLPLTVSDVLAQVITECDNADASVSSLARIMAGDQALAAMVLKLANSAYYGYARRIESLPDAVVLLGFASVKNLAITASITRLLATDQDDLHRDPLGHLRPLAVHRRLRAHPRPHPSRLGREGVRRRPAARPRPDRARLLRQGSLPPAVRGRRPSANVPLEDVELEVLGFTTAALGSAVAAEWQFPPALCDALAHQHDPSAAEADPLLARTVHLADWLAKRLGVGFTGPAVREEPDAAAADRVLARHRLARSASSPRPPRSSRKASRCARSARPPSSARLPYDRSPATRPIGGRPVLFMVIERFAGPRPEADLPAPARSRARPARRACATSTAGSSPASNAASRSWSATTLSLLQQWVLHWDGLAEFEIVPVLTSAETRANVEALL